MEETLKTLNDYFALISLKAFCEHYELNYEFIRQVLQGQRPLTTKTADKLTEKIKIYHKKQQEIMVQL